MAMEDDIRQCISEFLQLRKQVIRLAGDFDGHHQTYQKP